MNMISYSKRMNQPFLMESAVHVDTVKRKKRVNVVDETTKTVRSKIQYVTVKRSDEMKPYRVSDFSISNLTAIGAQLSPTSLPSSPLSTVSNFANALASVELPNND